MDISITTEEEKAIKALERLARKWPKTLQLFSWNGSLCVFKKTPCGTTVLLPFSEALSIPNDGGDPDHVYKGEPDVFYEAREAQHTTEEGE